MGLLAESSVHAMDTTFNVTWRNISVHYVVVIYILMFMSKNVFLEVTVTFDHHILISSSMSGHLGQI